jgi:calcium-dependent protein kinase
VIGTPYYIAPEMLSGNYSKVVDCWSLGVILYMLLSGTPPFNGKNNEEILMNVYSGSFTFRPKPFKTVSNSAKDLIARLLTKDPLHRITAQQAYMHPWIQELEPRVESVIPDSILLSLKNFSRSSHLKKASLIYIASKIASDEVSKMRNIFKQADRDGDGEISKLEFLDIVRVNSKVNTMDLEVMCSYLDVNKNGVIDYTEFIAGCMIRDSFTQDEWIRLSFEYFDTSKTGYITAENLKDALSGGDLMVGISKSEIEAIIQQADLNKDQKIDFSEFSYLMKSCSMASNIESKS